MISFDHLKQSDLVIDEIYQSNGATNSSGDVLSQLMSVGTLGGFRKRMKSDFRDEIAYVVLESTQNEIDWMDEIDIEDGIVTYYGDNRQPGQELHNTSRRGNDFLRQCFENLNSGKRAEIPPIFYFQGAGGRDRKFIGLLVPGDDRVSAEEQLVAVWRVSTQSRYQNYKARLSILDESCIDRKWLDDLRSNKGVSSQFAPKTWKKWVSTGKAKRLTTTRVISYRTKNEQLPVNTLGSDILREIHMYFSNPYMFELCAIAIVEMMDSNIHDCQHTQLVRDGGRDGVGLYRIGRKADGIDIDFALEAKCYDPQKSEVGVKEMARLISRLKYRQFGILVTTSAVGKQAYEEIRMDQQPIIVVSGKDIVDILYQAGIKTLVEVREWLKRFPAQ